MERGIARAGYRGLIDRKRRAADHYHLHHAKHQKQKDRNDKCELD
jgi:hypothetical protein